MTLSQLRPIQSNRQTASSGKTSEAASPQLRGATSAQASQRADWYETAPWPTNGDEAARLHHRLLLGQRVISVGSNWTSSNMALIQRRDYKALRDVQMVKLAQYLRGKKLNKPTILAYHQQTGFHLAASAKNGEGGVSAMAPMAFGQFAAALKLPVVTMANSETIPGYVKKESPGKKWEVNRSFSVEFDCSVDAKIEHIMSSIVANFDTLADMVGAGLPGLSWAYLDFKDTVVNRQGGLVQGFNISLRHKFPYSLVPPANVDNSVSVVNSSPSSMTFKTEEGHLLNGYITFALARVNRQKMKFTVHPTADFSSIPNACKFTVGQGSVLENRIWENLCTKVALKYGV
ncbi:hypothetical protein [Deinococcus multiflagellatus]|uniref:Uncharacterized protein n=1 Tax=Deinococcus multiflagellatus TaxID=1656887 RepID=A0ABW1ZNA4_9DEIO|nr:hypothetical protein [Deinococcus multiflagellatus]MBZ9712368.1 hypothetical protein [Deinococcus multiflagellatus]